MEWRTDSISQAPGKSLGLAGEEPLSASKSGQVGFIPKQILSRVTDLERVRCPGHWKAYVSQGLGPHARHGLRASSE